MEAIVKNVRIRELIRLLADLHMKYEVADIILEPERNRIIIDPLPNEDLLDNLNKAELDEGDIDDLT